MFPPSDPAEPRSVRWPHIAKLLAKSGHITIGRIAPIDGAAVAADQHSLLATIVRRPEESFEALLQRLDHAIGLAFSEGTRTNEIKDGRFELAAPVPEKRMQ